MPGGASCQLNPAAINFGIAQLSDIFPCNGGGVGNVTVTIQNTGTVALNGNITFTHNPGNPTNAPVFQLQSGQPSNFSVAPGGALGVVLQSFACRTNADEGLYRGTANFGPTCGNVALSLEVSEI